MSSKAFWSQLLEDQDHSFAILRRGRPVSWQRTVDDAVIPDPDDPGLRPLRRLEDIQRVSRDPETFSSGHGVLFDMPRRHLIDRPWELNLARDPTRTAASAEVGCITASAASLRR